jgi:hypothetical protein
VAVMKSLGATKNTIPHAVRAEPYVAWTVCHCRWQWYWLVGAGRDVCSPRGSTSR